jgi:cation diffusion facilitator CzcD-associated flavoprotein CzcO
VDTDRNSVSAPVVVIATGWADFPFRPSWPGSDTFAGSCIHSSQYRNASSYIGKRVLVVGFGNSGAEIALDLAEAHIDTTMAVRGPVQVLPRDLLGIPILTWAIAQHSLPARLVDFINAPILRLAVGPIERLGLRRTAKGPRRMIEKDGRVPLLDIGTLARIRDGSIKLRGGIDRFTPDGVIFSDQHAEAFDAVILATGFRPDLRPLLPDQKDLLNGQGGPLVTGRATSAPGLYFCGLVASATGQLREIGLEARRIGKLARRQVDSQKRKQAGAPNSAV